MTSPILYVEDGADDVFFMKRAFKTINPKVDLRVITDGQAAADFFDSTKTERPVAPLALIILDLNLPGRSGLEVLEQIRSKYAFPKVPVVLFSASSQQTDIDACYAGGCNAYVIKPSDPADLKALVAELDEFWLKRNRSSQFPGGVAIVSQPGPLKDSQA